MIGLLYQLLIGNFTSCKHKWAIIKGSNCVGKNGDVWGTVITMQCKNCGEIKYKTIRPMGEK